jgi:hypothetical protein
MKLLSKVFKSVKKNNLPPKKNPQPNKTKTKTCQLVSDLDVVGGFCKRPSPPSYKPDLPLITNLL